jgi:hypothetical protein
MPNLMARACRMPAGCGKPSTSSISRPKPRFLGS